MAKKRKNSTAKFDSVANGIAGTNTPWNRDMKDASKGMSENLRGSRVLGFVDQGDETYSLVLDDGNALRFFDVVKHHAGVVVYSFVVPDKSALNTEITRVSFDPKVLNVSEITDDDGKTEGFYNLSSSLELFGRKNGKEVSIGMVLCAIQADADSDFYYNTRISFGPYEGEMDFEDDADDAMERFLDEEIVAMNKNLSAEINKNCLGASVESYHSTDDLHGMVFYMSNGVSFTVQDMNKTCEFDVLTRDGVEDIPCKKFEYGLEPEIVDIGNGPEVAASVLRFYHSKLSKKPSLQLVVLVPEESSDDEHLALDISFNRDAVN